MSRGCPDPLAYSLDAVSRQFDALLTAEQRQQDRHAIVWPLASEKRQMTGEWPLDNPHGLAGEEHLASGRSTRPPRSRARISAMTLSGTRAGWVPPIIRPSNTGGPPCAVPLQLDGDETVPRKERRSVRP